MNSKAWEQSSYLAGANAPYVEELYESYLADSSSVTPAWQAYFASLNKNGEAADIAHSQVRDEFRERAKHRQQSVVERIELNSQQEKVDNLIHAFRRYGHYSALIDPLLEMAPALTPVLTLAYHQLDDAALTEQFATRNVLPQATATLKEIYDRLKQSYCQYIGFEYDYMDNHVEREWLRIQIEKIVDINFSVDEKKALLQQLVAADTLERYLDVKYTGQKRFSIEGGDALIPMLRELCEVASSSGMKEMVIGMAHRGRLNVLLNVLGHPSARLFQQFDGTYEKGLTSGDVKYHRGFSSDVVTKSGNLHLSLMFNPSHLEFINTVAMGSARARQDRQAANAQEYAMPILIHGDAAFAGQGIVMETLAMSQTRAYTVGGSLHIIINNQIGFTTSDVSDARSSHYCSDPAKMISIPIFHVNADDVESVVKTLRLAFKYREQFHKDVLIDLVCYRRHGHQEVDEPMATQPIMYQNIKAHKTAAQLYAEQLIAQTIVTDADYKKMIENYRQLLDQGASTVQTTDQGLVQQNTEIWNKYLNHEWDEAQDTAVNKSLVRELGEKLVRVPESFELHRSIKNLVTSRLKMAEGEQPMDWGFAEMMAYATLLHEGFNVRLVGEDVRRGTFYHRQVRYLDQKTGADITPLAIIAKEKQATLSIYDSLLSETGAMGFEYGYSAADPTGLVVWEAQFGDFSNVAQVIIDQFISSGCQKWDRLCGLVLLLPHGYEGMGPEHSSARLERYLQLCAQDNMQVCVPSTPAQIFHLLRRQVLRHYRKPLIVMTPKSLLRHKLAVSTIEDLATGGYKVVLPDPTASAVSVTRVIFCSGKIYYELLQKREELVRTDVAIVRIEQQYPFPSETILKELTLYTQAKEVIWCQEEPKNQGAWFFMRDRFAQILKEGMVLAYAGRQSSAAPACGYLSLHNKEQAELIAAAFAREMNDKSIIKI